MAQHVEALCAEVEIDGKVVLEVGADWHGVSASLLVEAGAARVISSNFEPGFERRPSGDERIERRRIDARSLSESLGPNSIDVVFGVAVMEHIFEIPRFLASAREALSPGGRFFVQGAPLWTSRKGHHVWVDGANRAYHFSDVSNPVDDWHHLVRDREELKSDLLSKGIESGDAEAIVAFVYDSDGVNRVGYRTMCDYFANSGFREQSLIEACALPPSDDLAARITRGPYGDEERFDVVGLTFVGRA